MHAAVRRELERAGIGDATQPPTPEAWQRFLDLVSRALARAEQERSGMDEALRGAEQELQTLRRSLTREPDTDLTLTGRELEAHLRKLRETQDQLVQSGKMAAIGTLVAGLSHELNNPIGVILGFAQSLLRRTAAVDPARPALASIEREALRCAHLVRSLLDFSRKSSSAPDRVAPSDVLSRVAALASGQARRSGVALLLEMPPTPLPDAWASGPEIESALLNLVTNALDATESGRWVQLSAAAADDDMGVELHVADAGHGIPAELLPRVFEPFFTTKPVGRGTGLGLSLARQLVEANGGRLSIESAVGVGTTVRLWLPTAANDAATAREVLA